MRSIYKKIEIKPDLLIVFFLSFIAGLFKDMIIFFLIIFIHEMGHIISSLIYNWNIKKVVFSICGGFTLYEEIIDKPFKEEFLISISGFLLQTLFYLICLFLYKNNYLDLKIISIIKKYNYSILLFNMLPIIPLDGSKIINVILNIFIPYKKTLEINYYLSLITIFLCFFYIFFFSIKIEASYIMIICFLIKSVVKEKKDIPYLFNKFLLEKYCYPSNNYKNHYIYGLEKEKFKRQKNNLFITEKKLYTQREFLEKIFD